MPNNKPIAQNRYKESYTNFYGGSALFGHDRKALKEAAFHEL